MGISPSDMRWLETVILTSGIGTHIQREAIIRRIKDRRDELQTIKDQRTTRKEDKDHA